MDFGGFETGKGVLDLFDLGGTGGVVTEGAQLFAFGEDFAAGEDVDYEGCYDAAPGGGVHQGDAESYPLDLVVGGVSNAIGRRRRVAGYELEVFMKQKRLSKSWFVSRNARKRSIGNRDMQKVSYINPTPQLQF